MGSSSKGGSGSTRKCFATIAGVIGVGPLYGLRSILLAGEEVWSGPIYRGGSSAPVNLSTKYGTIRLYWGTEDQPADSTLNQYEDHPSYPGIAYIVFVDFDHGQSTNAYNCELLVLGGPPSQQLIDGDPVDEALDSGITVNPIAMAAEILSSPAWLGLPATALDAPSAQVVANSVHADRPTGAPAGRSAAAVSPLYDQIEDARSLLAALAGMANAWIRVNTAGEIEFGRWPSGTAQVWSVGWRPWEQEWTVCNTYLSIRPSGDGYTYHVTSLAEQALMGRGVAGGVVITNGGVGHQFTPLLRFTAPVGGSYAVRLRATKPEGIETFSCQLTLYRNGGQLHVWGSVTQVSEVDWSEIITLAAGDILTLDSYTWDPASTPGWSRIRWTVGPFDLERDWLAQVLVDMSARALEFDDFAELPEVQMDDSEEAPNSYAVEFTDREALHKGAKVPVDDLAGIVEAGGVLRRNTLSAPYLVTYDQAIRAGEEALRRSLKTGRCSAALRYGKGAMVQPGDLLSIPVSAPGDATIIRRIVQVNKVTYPRNATDAIRIEGDFAPAAAVATAAAYSPPASPTTPSVMPPINLARAFAFPAGSAAQAPVHILACRPHDTALGFDIRYDDSAAGDFPEIDRQLGFAIPLTLGSGLAAGAGTVRVATLAAGGDGERYTRDLAMLTNWTGGETEGRDDSFLLVLFAIDGAGAITAQEVCSIAGSPTIVAEGTYDVPILRGRLGTAGLAWAAAAWSTVEVWIVPRGSLVALDHSDFQTAPATGAPLYFRLGAYSRVEYTPADADAERQRRAGAAEALQEFAAQVDSDTWSPQLALVIPPTYGTSVIIDGGQI